MRLLKQGQKVLDLGCAPGSWSLYVCERIGESGRLLAVDLQAIAQVLPKNAIFVQGDATVLANDVLATYAPYDVVLSDMAPNTTGNRSADQARSYNLFSFALYMAEKLGGRARRSSARSSWGPTSRWPASGCAISTSRRGHPPA